MIDALGMIMTDRGKALQTKVQAGAMLQYTRIALGSGRTEDIAPLNSLVDERLSVPVQPARVISNTEVQVTGVLTNDNLASGFRVNEIGVFAQDPDDGEVLYAYTAAIDESSGGIIPAGGGATRIEQTINLIVAVSDADTVIISPVGTDAYVLWDLFMEDQERQDNEISALWSEKVDGKWRIYHSLEALGITPGEETIESITIAMEVGSSLFAPIYSTNNLSIYPWSLQGHLLVHKSEYNRITWDYIYVSGNRRWSGNSYMNETAETVTWTGWKEVIAETRSAAVSAQTIYVATTGNDTTGDGTSSKPFASVGRAFQEANATYQGSGTITINIGAGTFNESATIAMRNKGFVDVVGAGTTSTTINFTTSSSYMYFLNCTVHLRGLTIHRTTLMDSTVSTVYLSHCRFDVNNVRLTSSVAQTKVSLGVYANLGSIGRCINVQVSNHYQAISVDNGAFLNTQACTGSGNTVGLHCQGSIIVRSGTIPTATTATQTTSNGQIFGTS